MLSKLRYAERLEEELDELIEWLKASVLFPTELYALKMKELEAQRRRLHDAVLDAEPQLIREGDEVYTAMGPGAVEKAAKPSVIATAEEHMAIAAEKRPNVIHMDLTGDGDKPGVKLVLKLTQEQLRAIRDSIE